MTKLVVWWNKAKFDAFRALLTDIIRTRVALPRDAKQDFYSVAVTEDEKNSGKRAPENTRELWGEATFLVPAGKSPFPSPHATTCLPRPPPPFFPSLPLFKWNG